MRTIQFREAICEAMSEEMRRDESIYLMGEEVAEYNGAYKASKGMLDEFGPKRIIDTPIAEGGFAGISVGAAMNGNRPIVEFMTFNFSLVAIDQIINNAAKMRQMSAGQFNIPIVFRGPTASAGQLAATHSQAFENWYANCPGLKVVVPSTPYDAKGLLKSAIRDNDPVIFMESEQMYGDKGEVPEEEYTIPLGVADIKRAGKDVTVVSFGKIIKEAHKAADILAKEGIECEIKYIFYDNLYDLESLYLKNAQEYDGIITSGPIGYEIIKNSVELFTPLYHFDISKGDLYKYLFNILKENPKIDFSRVYIDFISPEKKEYWFQDVFKKEEEPIFYQINFSNKNLYETLKSNYINLKKENKIDMVLTRISNMVKFLKNEEISFDFLFPSEENIKNTVLEVIKDIKILKSEKKQIILESL